MESETAVRPLVGFWRSVVRFEASKFAPVLALRNTLGLAIPLVVGVATGSAVNGLVAATGALNVSFSDGDDPYRQRARRMLASSVLVAFAVCLGAISGQDRTIAGLVTILWAFGAGMLVALGPAADDIALVSLVTFVVFSAQSMPAYKAFATGLLALAGGLLQTGLSLALWPVRRYEPERRVLGELYRKLALTAAEPAKATEAPPATAEVTQARETLAPRALDHGIESERYLILLSQAERMRLSLLVLSRNRQRLERQEEGRAYAVVLDQCFDLSSGLLDSIADWLISGDCPTPASERTAELSRLVEELREAERHGLPASVGVLVHEAGFQLEALVGQFRSATDLAVQATPPGQAAFADREARKQWTLRLAGKLATLRANLTFHSVSFRHAVRLASCIAAGEFLAGMLGWQRSYWLPMTIAIVLKPDFTSTFSRGVLRIAGTLVGLVLTTALFHLHPPGPGLDVALVALAFFVLRCFGPANYGLFVAAVSALVVLLIAVTGVDPKQVIAARAWNTGAGGALTLLAYAVWPTWERNQVSDALANMLDVYFRYFQVVAEAYLKPDASFNAELDRARLAGRLSRSNAESSVDRVSAEPGVAKLRMNLLAAILANSHRFVHAVMALEAGLEGSRKHPARAPFQRFSWDVELTLHSLAAALRGSPLSPEELPDLRADHRALVQSGDPQIPRYAIVNLETDRLTNALNTLSEHVMQWTLSRRPAADTPLVRQAS